MIPQVGHRTWKLERCLDNDLQVATPTNSVRTRASSSSLPLRRGIPQGRTISMMSVWSTVRTPSTSRRCAYSECYSTFCDVWIGYGGGGVELPRPFAAPPIPSFPRSEHAADPLQHPSVSNAGTSVISVPPWNVSVSSFVLSFPRAPLACLCPTLIFFSLPLESAADVADPTPSHPILSSHPN